MNNSRAYKYTKVCRYINCYILCICIRACVCVCACMFSIALTLKRPWAARAHTNNDCNWWAQYRKEGRRLAISACPPVQSIQFHCQTYVWKIILSTPGPRTVCGNFRFELFLFIYFLFSICIAFKMAFEPIAPTNWDAEFNLHLLLLSPFVSLHRALSLPLSLSRSVHFCIINSLCWRPGKQTERERGRGALEQNA